MEPVAARVVNELEERGAPRRRVPLAVPAIALVAALVSSGCGTVIDRTKLEDTLTANLERSGVEGDIAVTCPGDIEVDPGRRFSCIVRISGGRREVATLLIRNSEADVSLLNLKPDK